MNGLRARLHSAVAVAKARFNGHLAPIAVRLRRTDGDHWEASNDDPQLLFAAPPPGDSVMTVVLDARPNFIQPQLFFDWGDGFHGSDAIRLGGAQMIAIRLHLRDAKGLKKIRLDPADGRCAFDLRVFLGPEPVSASDVAARQIEEAREQGALAALEDVECADFAPARNGRPLGLKREPRGAQDHFLRAVALARREFSRDNDQAPATDVNSAPLISFIVPVYNTLASYLDDLLESFEQQQPGLAELILSDDGSTSEVTVAWLKAHIDEPGVIIHRCARNGGIAAASNEGIAVSRGEWIGFVDHDDALAPCAALALARAIRENPRAQLIYTDELIADKKLRGVDFFHKPAFDPVLLSGVNYINHLSLYRRERVVEIGCFRKGFEGSQDYDLLLRYLSGLEPSQIRHLPYPAYIWRRDGATYSTKYLGRATKNARRAISEAYSDAELVVAVEPAVDPNLHRLRFDTAMRAFPKVSIVIPNLNSFPLIKRLLKGLVNNTDYPDFEIVVVDNGTTDQDVLELYRDIESAFPNFRAVIETAPFNFSRQVNLGMKLSSGTRILLLNNDIEIIEPGWLREMASCFEYPGVGIVGARLLYPNGTLQHAGVIVGLGDFAGHWFVNQAADFAGPMARLLVRSSMTAVTAACMMISRDCLERTGMFDEQNFAVAYNDIDFCLRARKAGFRTIYTPFATLVHNESVSRGRDDKGPNRPRFLRDQAALLEAHATDDFDDPAYSPWYGRHGSEPYIITLDALPKTR